MPSSSRVSLTWQPSRLVSVSPNAMPSMLFSSSSASGNALKCFGERMMWHVEHATEPSHAPAGRWDVSTDMCDERTGQGGNEGESGQAGRAFEVDVVLVRNAEDVVTLVPLDRLDQLIDYDGIHRPTWMSQFLNRMSLSWGERGNIGRRRERVSSAGGVQVEDC
jgi:hypothetical protein